MSRLLIAIFLIVINSLSSFSQCSADAGEDIHSCPNDPDALEVEIGGAPTASIGTPPFEYTWSIDPIEIGFPGSGIIINASDVLTDTTSANPLVIDRTLRDSLVFYLEVEDSFGCVSRDTCVVSFSNFYYYFADHTYNIMDGDSVYLNKSVNVDVNNDIPLSYLWQPSHGLSIDTLSSGFWAKPTHDVSYYVTIEDSFGCGTTGAPLYHVKVHHLGLDLENSENNFLIYPNPASDQIQLVYDNIDELKRIIIYNSFGEVVEKMEPTYNISVSDLPAGNYLVELMPYTGESIFREVIVK